MLRVVIRRLTFVTVALISVACGGTTVTEITGPEPLRCQIALASTSASLTADGGQLTVGVSAARECTWTATSEAAWMRISPSTGQGEASLTLTVDQNGAALPRNGAIVLNGVRMTVAQAPAPCRFELNGSSARLSYTGGRVSVTLSTLADCTWTVANTSAWVRALTESGKGPGTVEFDVDRNSDQQRAADVTIAGQRFTLMQESVPPAPPSPPPSTPGPSPTPPAPTPPPTPPVPTPTPPPPTPTPPPAPPPAPPPPAPPPTQPPAPPPSTPTPPAPPPPSAPTPVRDISEEGKVAGMSGSCPAIRFELKRRIVVADSQTKYKDLRCQSLRNGDEVKVKGVLLSDGTIRAEEIRAEDKDKDDEGGM